MKHYGLIYKCTNRVNGKVYIGQTVNTLEYRRKKHLENARVMRYDFYFYRALNKYGYKNFTWEVIDYAESRDELNMREVKYIKELRTTESKFGYNISSGGSNGNNFLGKSEKEKEEIRKKISDKRKSYYKSNKHWNSGLHWNEEVKNKISKGNLKREKDSFETRLKKSLSHKGRLLSQETKTKISLSNRGRTRTTECRSRMSIRMKGNNNCIGRVLSDETKNKIRLSHKGKGIGINNGMYGKVYKWANNGIIERRFEINDFNNILLTGWLPGRI